MICLPKAAEPLLNGFSRAFTARTFDRWLRLCVAAIIAIGPRTVTNLIWSARAIMPGHFSTYHRVFGRARWSLWPLARVLSKAIASWIDLDQPIVMALDDTVAEHRGPKVYGRGCHRDPTRSSHRMTSYRWGHRWVVLAINVKFAFITRPWALPVACALYRPREVAAEEGRRFKTPPVLGRQLIAAVRRWLPDRSLIVVADGGFATHDLAMFAHRHREHFAGDGGDLTFIFRFYDHASLYRPAPENQKRGYKLGRPAIKGAKLPSPNAVVQTVRGSSATVLWYGGGTRSVKLISRCGMWYRSGVGVAPLRWVHVRDAQGTHRDEYLASTNPSLDPTTIVSTYTNRWSIEVTFQEVRRHLGFHTPRQRKAESVMRTAPCLLGLFSVIALIFAQHHRRVRQRSTLAWQRPWYEKTEPTFADALADVRMLFWQETFKYNPAVNEDIEMKPTSFPPWLLHQLCRAA